MTSLETESRISKIQAVCVCDGLSEHSKVSTQYALLRQVLAELYICACLRPHRTMKLLWHTVKKRGVMYENTKRELYRSCY